MIGHVVCDIWSARNTYICFYSKRREESIEGRSSIFLEDMAWEGHKDFNQMGHTETDTLLAKWTNTEGEINKLFL